MTQPNSPGPGNKKTKHSSNKKTCRTSGYKSCTSAITSVRLVDSGEPQLSFNWKNIDETIVGRKEVVNRIKSLNEENGVFCYFELRQVGWWRICCCLLLDFLFGENDKVAASMWTLSNGFKWNRFHVEWTSLKSTQQISTVTVHHDWKLVARGRHLLKSYINVIQPWNNMTHHENILIIPSYEWTTYDACTARMNFHQENKIKIRSCIFYLGSCFELFATTMLVSQGHGSYPDHRFSD